MEQDQANKLLGLLLKNDKEIKSFIDVLNLNSSLTREISIGDIEEDTGDVVESVIRYWNQYDDEQELKFMEIANQGFMTPYFKREPIKIYINSCGGSLLSTFTIIDAIKMSKTPVYTYNTGAAYSGGFFTFICGHKRFAYPHATFLFHEGSTGSSSQDAGKFRNYSDFYNRQLKELEKVTLENTKISPEEYQTHRNDDWWLFTDEAIEKGICDEIIKEF